MKSILPTTPNSETVLSLLHAHPLPTHHDQSRYYAYGTAGFRYAAGLLPPIVVRVGLIMALLLKEQMTTIDGKERSNTTITSNSNSMGVMITASHNDESYNGLKISNPDGSMIGPVQEALLVQWVNESSVEAWKGLLLQGQEESKSASSPSSSTPLGALHVGRDTRSHSLPLSDLLIQAATAMGVTTICNHGILTTPMLHHIVLYSNNSENKALASREAYLNHLANAYVALDQALTSTTSSSSTSSSSSSSKLPSSLQVDGACGVGYQATLDLQTKLAQLNPIYQNRFQARNPPTTDPSYLNDHCGSEHVQKQLQPPVWYDTNTVSKSIDYSYCCSVDGDADRIVFFASTTFADGNNTGNSTLLDGDKIAVLIATFIKQLMQRGDLPSNLTVGVVQTAYANGASTQYLQETLQIPVVITKTGVKHLHHAALQFDIGIYFEANGHGTVLFSKEYHESIGSSMPADGTSSNVIARYLPQLINPAVGDALSDLLLVDLLLRRHFGWTLKEWANEKLYQDLPSRQLKVKVEDRSMIVCNDNETRAVSPMELQAKLEQAMDAMVGGTTTSRCFVRPSGTENVVRIYAEASTRALADQLATQAAQIVHETCRGVGPLPKI